MASGFASATQDAVLAAWQGLVKPQSFLAKRRNYRSKLLHPEMRFLDFLF
jgi:hypothetical protein